MRVVSATVVLSDFADHIMLRTDLPTPMPKFDNMSLAVSFQAEQDTGIDYVRKHFGVEPHVVNHR